MGQWGGNGEGEGIVSRSGLLGEVGWGMAEGMWEIVALSGCGWVMGLSFSGPGGAWVNRRVGM